MGLHQPEPPQITKIGSWTSTKRLIFQFDMQALQAAPNDERRARKLTWDQRAVQAHAVHADQRRRAPDHDGETTGRTVNRSRLKGGFERPLFFTRLRNVSGGSPRRSIAGKAKASEAHQHHRPGGEFRN